jgi:hypothetical protein
MKEVSTPLKNHKSTAVNTTEITVTFATKRSTEKENMSLKLLPNICTIKGTHF